MAEKFERYFKLTRSLIDGKSNEAEQSIGVHKVKIENSDGYLKILFYFTNKVIVKYVLKGKGKTDKDAIGTIYYPNAKSGTAESKRITKIRQAITNLGMPINNREFVEKFNEGGSAYSNRGKTRRQVRKESVKKDDIWIQKAEKEMENKGTVGAFTAQAKKAGMSPKDFAKKVLKNENKYSNRTVRRAQFMKNTNPELFAEGGKTGEKRYYRKDGIGKAKYTISKHDGVQKHKDGSPFYDIKIFSNKKDRDNYEKELLSNGYVYRYAEGGHVANLGGISVADVATSQPIVLKDGGSTYEGGGEIEMPNSNLYLVGSGRDTNGNRIVKVKYPNSRVFSFQTLGNLPHTHRALSGVEKMAEVSKKDIEKIEKEIADWIKKYGSDKQKKSLKTYFSDGGSTEYVKGKNYPVKSVSKSEGEKMGLSDFPNFSSSGSVSGMKKQFYGKDALLIKSGGYIYNVTSEPSLYFDIYAKGGSTNLGKLFANGGELGEEVHIDELTEHLGRPPKYPYEDIEGCKMTKCMFRPYYKVVHIH